MATSPAKVPGLKTTRVAHPRREQLPSKLSLKEAKAHLLRMVASLEDTGEYVLTKRGKPVAKLIPFDAKPKKDIYGCMAGTVQIVGDIVGPEPDEWDALR